MHEMSYVTCRIMYDSTALFFTREVEDGLIKRRSGLFIGLFSFLGTQGVPAIHRQPLPLSTDRLEA